ncbi:hypothetical protein [Actinacidiphila soli]|uniref:hypothetical protein n=1 Tax=Actinacidiphila soli TaxID=2487275 RepID=UPI000FCB8603|nr:hypothetical protein [Actinacidiphila soli]
MPFPPSDMVAAYGIHLHFQALERMLLERHPKLAGRVYFNSAEPHRYLRVKLSGDEGVGLALVRSCPLTDLEVCGSNWSLVRGIPE